MATWEGLAVTIMDKWLTEVSDLTKRKNLLLSIMRERGTITHNAEVGGDGKIYRDVQYRVPPTVARTEGQNITYQRQNYYKQASMGMRQFIASDAITKEEELIRSNAGSNQIINRVKQILPKLTNEMQQQLSYQLHGDGSSLGAERWDQPIEGFASFTSHNSANTAANDVVAYPNDTYHGLSTALQAHGGEWGTTTGMTKGDQNYGNAALATSWPWGKGDVGYDCWTPRLLRYDVDQWGETSTSWSGNCLKCLREAAMFSRMLTGMESPIVAVMPGNFLTDIQAKMASSYGRLELTHPLSSRLGFPTVMNFEGTMLYEDFGVDGNRVDLWNFEKVRLYTVTDKLFERMTWPTSDDNLMKKFLIMFFGNLMFESPKYFSSIQDFATA